MRQPAALTSVHRASSIRLMRVVRLILAVYVLVWFGMVVPGHKRGLVRLPDSRTPSVSAAKCPACVGGSEGKNGKKRSGGGSCAICFVAATYSTPPVFVIDLGLLFLVGPAADPPTATPAFVARLMPFWPTGPPGRC